MKRSLFKKISATALAIVIAVGTVTPLSSKAMNIKRTVKNKGYYLLTSERTDEEIATYKYDKNNKLIEVNTSEPLYSMTVKYDTNGNVVRTESLSNNQWTTICNYKNNLLVDSATSGYITGTWGYLNKQECELNSDGTAIKSIKKYQWPNDPEYSYIEFTEFNPNGKCTYKRWACDSNYEILDRDVYDVLEMDGSELTAPKASDDSLRFYENLKNDKKNWTITTDKDGKITKAVRDKDKTHYECTDWKYDKNGNPVSFIEKCSYEMFESTVKHTLTWKFVPNYKVGQTVKVDGNTYKITKELSPSTSYGEVTLIKAKSAKNIVIADTVKIGGGAFKIKAVNDSILAGNKKVQSLSIGKNVKKIGKSAFSKCVNLKSITINTTKLTSSTVGKSAFAGLNSKLVVKVPKSKLKAYKTLLKAKGVKGKNQTIVKK